MQTAYEITLKIFAVIGISVSPFIVSMFIQFVIKLFRGYRLPKSEYHTKRRLKHGSKLKRLFFDFPKAFVNDLFNRNPDRFPEYGFRIIAGKQGSGKTITMTYLLQWYKKRFPAVKIATNYNYRYEDKQINTWRDLLNSNNGELGEIDVIDEVQNWFSSNQSKDFPPSMLSEITQQRKQTKVIFGTSQVFSRVAKPIREQTYLLYEPHTFFGCLTFVLRYEPEISAEDGQADKKKLRGMFFFVHTPKVRESFDTYKKISKYSKQGFQERIAQPFKDV